MDDSKVSNIIKLGGAVRVQNLNETKPAFKINLKN